MIILDIFARHAVTAEGKLQVELAQLHYTQAHLLGMRSSLSRLGGGVGTRGPGEQKLELDRRAIRARISFLREKLGELKRHREVARAQREKSGSYIVALVGYTNAGKSTLLNRLTDAGILAENKLFATLDPTTRKLALPGGEEVLLTDTVGFIRKLPHQLIEAFHSTLEEARYADLILHVVDASSPEADRQMAVRPCGNLRPWKSTASLRYTIKRIYRERRYSRRTSMQQLPFAFRRRPERVLRRSKS